MPKDQDFLEYLIRSIVAEPERVRTIRTLDDMGVLIQLFVAPGDMGVVIGKRGTTASAIKLLTKLAGFTTDTRVSVKIQEPE